MKFTKARVILSSVAIALSTVFGSCAPSKGANMRAGDQTWSKKQKKAHKKYTASCPDFSNHGPIGGAKKKRVKTAPGW
jgi:hypothetical protein